MSNVHNLKLCKTSFNDVKSGKKPFEVLKNDGDYQLGDTCIFHEFDSDKEKYLSGWTPKEISYILDDPRFVHDGYVILGLKEINIDIPKKRH